MNFFRDMKIKYKMLLCILSMVFVTSVITSYIYINRTSKMMMEQFESKIRSLVTNFSYNAVYGVMIENKEILDKLIKNLLKEEKIKEVVIKTNDGKVIAETPLEKSDFYFSQKFIEIPVMVDLKSEKEISDDFAIFKNDLHEDTKNSAEKTGSVFVQYSTDEIQISIGNMRFTTIVTTIILFIFGSIIALFLASVLSAPINKVLNAMQKVGAGDLLSRVELRSKDEVGQLGKSFNNMAESLMKSREELKKTLDELARKERLATLGKFSSIVAHELKNPLGIILSSAQVIKNPAKGEEMRLKAAEYIEEEVKRLDRTISHFLKFAKPPEPKLSSCNIYEVIKNTLKQWENEYNKDGEIIVCFKCSHSLLHVMCDRDLIHQIFLNLFINGSQAMKNKGKLEISINDSLGFVEIEVSDTGSGISKENIENIFEPFFTTKKQGMGLGLSIVRQVVEAHGGEIRAENNKEGGAKIILKIPVEKKGEI